MKKKHDVIPRKRGRPRSRNTIVCSVRLPIDVYDIYCRHSNATLISVRSLMRRVLTVNASDNRPS